MKHEPDIFDHIDENADAESHRKGIADLDAGRTVSHEDMKAWAASLLTDNPKPRPR